MGCETVSMAIAEMREFASFAPGEQDYIMRALDIGLGRRDAFMTWGEAGDESAMIRSHYLAYQSLKSVRNTMPRDANGKVDPAFLAQLIAVSAFDLGQEQLDDFSAYRFLYERLLGPEIRAWLPSAFCAAAALPQIRPERRKMLLQSLSEAAATAPAWSDSQPGFYPEYLEVEAG